MTPPDTSRAEAEAHEFVADWLGIFDSSIRASAMNEFEQALANKLLRAKADGVRLAVAEIRAWPRDGGELVRLDELAPRIEKGEA